MCQSRWITVVQYSICTYTPGTLLRDKTFCKVLDHFAAVSIYENVIFSTHQGQVTVIMTTYRITSYRPLPATKAVLGEFHFTTFQTVYDQIFVNIYFHEIYGGPCFRGHWTAAVPSSFANPACCAGKAEQDMQLNRRARMKNMSMKYFADRHMGNWISDRDHRVCVSCALSLEGMRSAECRSFSSRRRRVGDSQRMWLPTRLNVERTFCHYRVTGTSRSAVVSNIECTVGHVRTFAVLPTSSWWFLEKPSSYIFVAYVLKLQTRSSADADKPTRRV